MAKWRPPHEDRDVEGETRDTLSLAKPSHTDSPTQSVRQLTRSKVTMARLVFLLALLVAAASAFVAPASHAGEYIEHG